jgi:hypothetical protein
VSVSAAIIKGMAEHQWTPLEHPDAPEDQPVGVAPDEGVTAIDPNTAPVTVRVTFTRTGPQRVPGFVELAGTDRVYAQFVSMGFVHHVWIPRDQVTHRTLRPRRVD